MTDNTADGEDPRDNRESPAEPADGGAVPPAGRPRATAPAAPVGQAAGRGAPTAPGDGTAAGPAAVAVAERPPGTDPPASPAGPWWRRYTPSRDAWDRRRVARVAFAVAWPLLLATWLTAYVGRYGFAPMDQGFTQALTWRILHGEVPHADFFSPRPAGSALFHIVDFAIPGPLMLVQAWIATLQFAVSAIALAVLVTGRPWTRFGPLLIGLTAAATMVNLHMWAAMTWHTTDGIFFASLGWCLIDRGVRRDSSAMRRWGLFLAGYAVICKQSFAPVALVALAMVYLHPRRTGRVTVRGVVRDLAALAAGPFAYVVWVVLAGGTAELPDQLLGTDSVWGERVLTMLPDMLDHAPREARWLWVFLAALAAVAAARLVARHAADGPVRRVAEWADPVACVVATAAVVAVPAQAKLIFAEVAYSVVLWWMLVAAVVVDLIVGRRVLTAALPVLALGWMVSLSYGYDVPALIGGSLALTTLVVLWRGAASPGPMAVAAASPARRAVYVRAAALTCAGVLVVGTGAVKLLDVRDGNSYIDSGRPYLTQDMGTVSPEMRGIRTSPGDRRYMEQVRDCVKARPAKWVAVLPDTSVAYPVFKLRNPFPMDWLYFMEVTNPEAEKLMVKRAKELDKEGDYLVLFQTIDVRFVAVPGYVPKHVPANQPIIKWTPRNIEVRVKRELHGEVFSCGSFVAVWAPPRT
ncbi:hypothetical protein LO772_25035 [Yinghuangia sp. ASG 101]|uniref:hypothetical protein n=1 Tax=Yinghuangia sp. ASG 101 TaxID=2896848 RepID=UPI001E2B6C8E|nr:hypothetical protein [Yinghuangia sp. ASG 101]UGQ10125.1 hypothetical protein LO772_25035 [Yinghuangia sp. ASG 101]